MPRRRNYAYANEKSLAPKYGEATPVLLFALMVYRCFCGDNRHLRHARFTTSQLVEAKSSPVVAHIFWRIYPRFAKRLTHRTNVRLA